MVGSGSWGGQTYTEDIDVSSAKILCIGHWIHTANHSSMSSSSTLTSNTGETLYSVPLGVNVFSETWNMNFDVSKYTTVTIRYDTNYSGNLAVQAISLIS